MQLALWCGVFISQNTIDGILVRLERLLRRKLYKKCNYLNNSNYSYLEIAGGQSSNRFICSSFVIPVSKKARLLRVTISY